MQDKAENRVLISARPEEVQDALRRILESRHFVHAPKKQKFLRLICDFYLNGKAGQLNEYLIGREVFDRTEEYRPTEDPIVRVGAHDVRKKLDLYYQNEGALDDVRLEIPIGSYEPVFLRRASDKSSASPWDGMRVAPAFERAGQSLAMAGEAPRPMGEDGIGAVGEVAVAPTPEPVATAAAPSGLPWAWIIAGASLLVIGALSWNNYVLRQQVRQNGALLERSAFAGPVWDPFLNRDSSTLLVLSNPVVYRLVNAGDTESAVKHSVALTPEQGTALHNTLEDSFVIRNLPGNPRLLLSPDNYTGVGEAIGAQRVTDLLRTAGKTVLLKRSRTVSAEDLKDSPAVLFGSVWSNEWSGKLPVAEDFLYTGQATIENHHPASPAELPLYRSVFDDRTGKLIEDYALITVKPSITRENVIMILSGLRSAGTEAAAEFATNRALLAELNQELRKLNSPRYYQALLKVSVENGIPTTIKLLAVHQLNVK